MNKGGQVIFVTLMLATVVIILLVSFANPLKQQLEDTLNETTMDGAQGLDCDNPNNNDFDRTNCVAANFIVPYFIIGLIGIAIALIGARVVAG